jgi:hypothetical protein
MIIAMMIQPMRGHCGRDHMVVWIYSYLWNQCLSQLTLWVQTPLRLDVLYTTLCDKVCQWLATGQWFSPDTSVSSTNKTDCQNITELLLRTIKPTNLTPDGCKQKCYFLIWLESMLEYLSWHYYLSVVNDHKYLDLGWNNGN